MAIFGPLSLYSRCVGNVSGINASSYSSETTTDQIKTTDECGNNANIVTLNTMSTHEWEGEIAGAGPTGICNSTVGASMTAPGGIWYGNQPDEGTLICTRGRYNEAKGEWATFSATGENNSGV